MRRPLLATAVLLIAFPVLTQAQEAHTIKVYKGKAGDSMHVVKSESGDTVVDVKDKDGNSLQAVKEAGTKSATYTETIVERPDLQQQPTKLKRAYDKSEQEKNGAKEVDAYAGKTVLIEKKDGKYRFQIEGGAELTGKDAAELDKEFNKKSRDKDLEELLLPTKPVKVGDTWTPDGDALLKGLNAEGALTATKVTASGKLQKVYEKNGRKYGVVDLTVEMTIKGIGEEGKQVDLETPAKMTMKGTMDVCIDGTSGDGTAVMAISMDGNSNFSVGGMQVGSIRINSAGMITENRTQKK